ncbi:nuclear transport factor 2 family protein [Inhella gelatinilytica]|uniref:Nuclear transport factor 2 family protein n=1 Tax=Inhella gelatinilytica TaxID=2795030 RepID=A0A931IWP4_9BURK|nr:nuclear transport factor 2 family protein [Inhella gelatinilytica]MBH9554212.1 nuclear transport factor 2 family protein [Inhella gelatinilytica]
MSRTPVQTIQAQVDAYNRKDLEAFLATYAEDAEQYTLHGELLAKGRETLRGRYLERFTEPDLHAQILSRSTIGHVVVDTELVTRNFPGEGKGTIEMICIYEVVDGLVRKASFVLGQKRLFKD